MRRAAGLWRRTGLGACCAGRRLSLWPRSGRLEAWAAIGAAASFETPAFGGLLRMRRIGVTAMNDSATVNPLIPDAALDRLYRTARSFNDFTAQPVTEA